MNMFHPHTRLLLPIGSAYYHFLPHPYFPDDDQEVFVIEGGEAFVYKLQHMGLKTFYALKVMKPGYRDAYTVKVAQCLAQYTSVPGLFLAQRLCLTRDTYPELIKRFPDLEYSVLFPWIEGRTWAGLISDPVASARYTLTDAKSLAQAMAYALWNLEAYSLAHTDIAGSNVVISPDHQQVQLIDLESLYIHGIKLPKKRSHGSPGYQHLQQDERGQCRLDGDRFAGAILLTEMLTWWNPAVRAQTPDEAESLFTARELQMDDNTTRLRRVRRTLAQLHSSLLELFDQAWYSASLEECPDFGTWSMALAAAFL
jgi:serine/threonine protein kinase